MNLPRPGTFLLALLTSLNVLASPESEMASAARNFLAALSDEQKATATFEFKSDERENWHFIPKERKGVTLGTLKPAQKHLAFALLQSGLSSRGFAKATTIMSLEQILQELEGPNRRFPRDPELYHVSLFGTPDPQGTWGWRFEGHHLSLNFTIVQGRFAGGTPSFLGTNPAEVRKGPRAGLRVLAAEEDLARELLTSLNPRQWKQALIQTNAPDDILTVANRTADVGAAKGLAFSDMTGTSPRRSGGGRPRPDRQGRTGQDPVRLGRFRRARAAPLLPRARADLPARVRQHPERREPCPRRVARFRQ
ncbi:MAG: DUF3500 domain-containing protein [Verrucomicrobium sp.]|nr:DUF3500 domain-containing protein [Verrucomicrobium sp.]